MNSWLQEHPWITFVLIYVGLAYIYNKVFKTRRLPVLKAAIMYVLFGIGALMLMLFQLDGGLPIVASMAVAVALMFMVRIRYWMEKRQQRKQ